MGVQCPSLGFPSVPDAAYQSVSVSFSGVVPGGEFSAHQHARDESHCSGSSCVSAPVVRSECRPDEGQRHGCCLPLKSEWHSVLCRMSLGCQGSALD